MVKEKLWTLGNREPAQMAYDLELARRKAGAHTKATPEAWQDFVALFKLLPEAIGRLIVLESERDDMHSRLRIEPPPDNVAKTDQQPYCEDQIAGPLAATAHDAKMKGWDSETVYRAMAAYSRYMIAFERKALGLDSLLRDLTGDDRERAAALLGDNERLDVPPYGSGHGTVDR